MPTSTTHMSRVRQLFSAALCALALSATTTDAAYTGNVTSTIKGLAYNPTPIGQSPNFYAIDYFTPPYAYLWYRDLPMIQQMGVTHLRIYGWNNTANATDHTLFLDEVHAYGLKVLLTYSLSTSKTTPVATTAQQQAVVTDFAAQVGKYATHPAVYGWSFGNEINGFWNGFLTDFSTSGNCGYTEACQYDGIYSSSCKTSSNCVYSAFFQWINSACQAAKQVNSNVICVSAMSDVDYLVNWDLTTSKIALYDSLMTHMDMWAVQLYRGITLDPFFQQVQLATNKTILVSEYGVDAYNDPCGWTTDNPSGTTCSNVNGDGRGGVSSGSVCNNTAMPCSMHGDAAQAKWNSEMATTFINYNTAGSFLLEWHDEFWKSANNNDYCEAPCAPENVDQCMATNSNAFAVGGSAGCTQYAHITCNDFSATYQDLCGYQLTGGVPDNYVNEAWFGLNAITACNINGTSETFPIDTVSPRLAYSSMQQLFTGSTSAPATKSCNDIFQCQQCLQQHSTALSPCISKCGLHMADTTASKTGGAVGTRSQWMLQAGAAVVFALMVTLVV